MVLSSGRPAKSARRAAWGSLMSGTAFKRANSPVRISARFPQFPVGESQAGMAKLGRRIAGGIGLWGGGMKKSLSWVSLPEVEAKPEEEI